MSCWHFENVKDFFEMVMEGIVGIADSKVFTLHSLPNFQFLERMGSSKTLR